MKPVKADIPTYTKFAPSMEDDDIDFQIENAYRFVLRSKLGSIADDIYSLAEDNLTRPELKTFYNEYVKEYWLLIALKRFLPTHGIQVTQYGIVIMTDPAGTFIPATSADRSAVMRMLDDDIAAMETVLFNRLGELKWTYDGTVYRRTTGGSFCSTPDVSGSTGGISAIG